jgi:hypothetical protein
MPANDRPQATIAGRTFEARGPGPAITDDEIPGADDRVSSRRGRQTIALSGQHRQARFTVGRACLTGMSIDPTPTGGGVAEQADARRRRRVEAEAGEHRARDRDRCRRSPCAAFDERAEREGPMNIAVQAGRSSVSVPAIDSLMSLELAGVDAAGTA